MTTHTNATDVNDRQGSRTPDQQRDRPAADRPPDQPVEPEQTGGPDQPEQPDRAGTEAVFELLDNQRRRSVVHYLLQHDGVVELRDLSAQVAAWENHEPVEEVTPAERHRVYNALQQVHLPKMARAGVIDYDRDRSTVAATPGLGDLRVYLEVVPGNDIPWSTYYLLLGLLSAALTVAVWTDSIPAPDIAAAVAITLLLTVSAAVHYRHNRRMSLGADGPPPEFGTD